ncbi:MAG: hypothetical protein ACRD1V_19720 [Vicinamibacterales bacterium]
MPLWIVRRFLFVAVIAATAQSSPPSVGQSAPPAIAGAWVLNPALTVRPDEIGFNADWARAANQSAGAGTSRPGGGRGRRGGSSSGGGAVGAPQIIPESADDSTRVQQLTAEARAPAVHLTIVQDTSSVSIADDQGLARTFHPDGKLEDLTIGTAALPTTAQWDAGSLIVVYDVENARQIRYTYTPSTNPKRLLVDIRFIDRKKEGDEVRLTYEPPDAQNSAILLGAPASPAAPPAGAAAPAATPAGTPSAKPTTLPPGSELHGLSTIAVDVDDLGAESIACGLDQTKIRNAISQILTDAGFKVHTVGEEDADVVVNIATSKLSDGVCVSRYDASVVSYGDTTFPYVHGTVAAVEVQLLHEGGMAGGSPAAHAASVMNALTKSVSHFVDQIRAANK